VSLRCHIDNDSIHASSLEVEVPVVYSNKQKKCTL
jgi:hypothetical protein